MAFIPLHVTSCYDFLSSAIKFDSLFLKLKEYGYKSCGIADFNTMFGYAPFENYAKQNNVKPIYGLDIRVDNNNFTLFAINDDGYKNLIKLSYYASLNNEDTQINIEVLQRFSSDLVAVITTQNSFLFQTTDQQEIAKSLRKYDSIFSPNLFIGLENYSSEFMSDEDLATVKRVRNFVEKYPYTVVAFPHIKYVEKDDILKLNILQAIKNQTTINLSCEQPKTGPNYLKNPADLQFSYTKQEIGNTNIIAEKCNFTFKKVRGKLLKFSENNSSKELLKNKSYEGLKKLNLDNNQTYIDRLERELSVINKMGYNDYFLIVEEYVNFAKNNNILVGPGRGSAAASLVSYCLNITEIDPIKYDLFFERFLNEERVSMPDIDVDFEDTRRNDIIQHLKDIYGEERVANISTITTSQTKGSLRDVGRVFVFNEEDINALCKLLVNPKLDFNESYKQIPSFKAKVKSDEYYFEIVNYANKILGYPRQRGLHAAGVVLNDEPLTNGIPIIYDSSIPGNVTQIEAPYLESMGYLKMDILGLTNLSTIHLILDLIERNKGIKIKFTDIPVDDPSIYKLINDGMTMGIFQIESEGMNRAIQRVKPQNIDDIISILALFRPGPMGNIDDYANRKNKHLKVNYLSKEIEKILAPTYGIIIYQEQIMQIAQAMAGFSLGKADILRRAISKKKLKEMEKLKADFISGCLNKGFTQKIAEETFDLIEKFASYGFAKPHSVAYAYITNKMAYLKANYPVEFYVGVLAGVTGNNDAKFVKYIDEIKRRNIKISLPNINKSSRLFNVDKDNSMIVPFTVIKGLNSKSVDIILYEREQNGPYKDVFDFILRTYPYKIGQEQIEKLINSGCFDDFSKNRQAILIKLPVLFQKVSLIVKSKGQSSLFNEKIDFDQNTPEDKLEKILKEYDLNGLMISDNPIKDIAKMNNFKGNYSINGVISSKSKYLIGMINNIKTIETKSNKKQMAYLSIMDENSDSISVTLFPNAYDEYADIIEKKSVYLFYGHNEIKRGKNEFLVEKMKKLEVKRDEKVSNN